MENATKFASCVVHAMATFLMTNSDSRHQQPPYFEGIAIFPKECGNTEGTTAAIITKILVGVKKKAEKAEIVIEGYPEKPTSTDLRSGSALFIANHKSKSLVLIFFSIALCTAFLPMNNLY